MYTFPSSNFNTVCLQTTDKAGLAYTVETAGPDVATVTVAATMCDDSNTQYFYPSNVEEELDTDNIAPPKTSDYRPKQDDEEMLAEHR